MSLRWEPDLVSKLREVIAKVKPLVEKATPMPWSTNSQFIPQASAKILVGSDRRSIAYVGMNPQSKEWETYAQDITNTLLIIAAVNAMDELESLLGLEGQAAKPQPTITEVILAWDAMVERGVRDGRMENAVSKLESCGPSQPETEGEAGRQPVCFTSPSVQAVNSDVALAHSAFAVPSTPIVPGTAGLSAFADEIKLLLKMAEDCDARGEVQSPQKEWTFYQGKIVAYKHILSLLGAAKPVGISIDALEDLMQQFKQREARIRKDVLEEARVSMIVPESLAKEIIALSLCAVGTENLYRTRMDVCNQIELWIESKIRALAERPAPAGEVEEKK